MAVREHWGSKFGFVLAAAGSAVGLGNVWKFPFVTGMYGGAAFILVYLLSIILVGMPIMVAEFVLGRRTQKNPVGAYLTLRPTGYWFLAGTLGVASGFVILSYYSVVAGWTIGYIVKAVTGTFSQFHDPAEAGRHFEEFSGGTWIPLGYHALFMGLTVLIVIKGVKEGIEKWCKILMPTLVIILLALVIRGISLPGSKAGLIFLMKPDFSKLTGDAILVALGHAFFTLSLGMGAMITYGSYLSKGANLISAAFAIVILDTLIALVAGVAIFSAVFAMGLNPAAGPGLVFHVLPAVFTRMPGGFLFGVLFFVLLAIAALTSAVSLMEVVTAYFVDEKGWSRKRATLVFGGAIFLLGVPASLSYGVMEGVTVFLGKTFFDFMDYLSFKYMLPIGGLLVALFIAWVWGPEGLVEEIRSGYSHFPLKPPAVRIILIISSVFILITLMAGIAGKI
ncbi:sodium-dependent transporter [candidate division KSB1 bacterium]|nr:sodium-dependent transporter [candidate division KSB1 bacterium]